MNKLMDVIRKYDSKSPNVNPKELLEKLSDEVKSFRNSSPQYDDITAIAITKEHTGIGL